MYVNKQKRVGKKSKFHPFDAIDKFRNEKSSTGEMASPALLVFKPPAVHVHLGQF